MQQETCLYSLEPNYQSTPTGLNSQQRERIRARLAAVYGEASCEGLLEEVDRIVRVHNAHKPQALKEQEATFEATERFTEKDVILITYGDLTVSDSRPPLRTLADFATVFFRGLITTLHILPFYPYSSDRGFSVTDFRSVDPTLGDWEDITALKRSFKLMFDGVFNHVSSQSSWFRNFLNGETSDSESFISFSSKEAIDQDRLKLILRPRTSDLLTQYQTVNGPRFVWTTFSSDQVDLNFRNPQTMLRILDVLLFYVRKGADLVRLDAVTYLWYELGTSCAHLNETHELIKLFRDVLDATSPSTALVTETNVPHADNITYFGDGHDEAQMVYNFALPPLVLHAFQRGSAATLTSWAQELNPPSSATAFFNFLDSHDGIGLMGARGILSAKEILSICDRVLQHGGLISMKSNGDGTESPYELNITWYSALNHEDAGESDDLQIQRFLASRAVALVLKGVPGIYLPSLFGRKNDVEAVFEEGSKRSINRATILEETLFEEFKNPESLFHRIADRYFNLIELRVNDPAFHPNADQRILELDERVFALLRTSVDGSSQVLSIINVSSKSFTIEVNWADLFEDAQAAVELISRDPLSLAERSFEIEPYGIYWLKP